MAVRGKIRVLIVDDSAVARHALAAILPEYDYIDFNRLHAELGDAPTEVKTAGLARFRARVARFAARLAG